MTDRLMIKTIKLGGAIICSENTELEKWTHDQVESKEWELSVEEGTRNMALNSEEKESTWTKKMEELPEGDV